MKFKGKKILIGGGSYMDIPLIINAKKLGFYVITTGFRETDLGHKYSDEYVKLDYSKKEDMLKLAERLKIDFICPCANDFSALSCSYVAEKLGLPGHDPYHITELIHNKNEFEKLSKKLKINRPESESFDNKKEAEEFIYSIGLPVIVKPVDLSTGRGISKINKEDQINYALEKAFSVSKKKKIIIEKFIQGTNHGFSAIIKNKKVVFFFCDDEHYFLNKYMVSGTSTPSSVPKDVQILVSKQVEKIASELNLKDGIFHLQFILKNNTPYIIDICRRAPGDLYIDFVKYATKIDFPFYILNSFIGEEIKGLKQVSPHGFFTRHCIMSRSDGILKEIHFNKHIKNNIINKLILYKKGDRIQNHLMTRLGIVFLKYSSLKEMKEKSIKLQDLIKVEIN